MMKVASFYVRRDLEDKPILDAMVELGADRLERVKLIEAADLDDLGMKQLEKRQFLKAVREMNSQDPGMIRSRGTR